MIPDALVQMDQWISRRKRLHVIEYKGARKEGHHTYLEEVFDALQDAGCERVLFCGKDRDYLVMILERTNAGDLF